MPIFDQGYQHWSGHLSSPIWHWLAITRRGVRTALQSRFVRIALILAYLPAIVLVGANLFRELGSAAGGEGVL